MEVKLEHRLGIRAPAEAIWAVIFDIYRWSEWNPLYPKAAGVIRIGSVLDLEVAVPGQAPRAIRPVVTDWVPNEQILWRLNMMAGLVRATRYIEIEQLSESGCIFSNGEIFGGLFGERLPGRLRGPIRAGFVAMGEALKARVEATWCPDAGVTI